MSPRAKFKYLCWTFSIIQGFCLNVLIESDELGCYFHMCTTGFYTKAPFVNYDSLLQEMHRHVLLRAGVQPSSAAQPDTKSTTSLDPGVSCQKSSTHRRRWRKVRVTLQDWIKGSINRGRHAWRTDLSSLGDDTISASPLSLLFLYSALQNKRF